jgi:hypothetical protein
MIGSRNSLTIMQAPSTFQTREYESPLPTNSDCMCVHGMLTDSPKCRQDSGQPYQRSEERQ